MTPPSPPLVRDFAAILQRAEQLRREVVEFLDDGHAARRAMDSVMSRRPEDAPYREDYLDETVLALNALVYNLAAFRLNLSADFDHWPGFAAK